MNWLRIRTLLIHLIGGVCGYLSFFGLHPFSIAYLAAVMMETPYRFSMVVPILVGMVFSADFLSIIKYGLIMLSMLFVTGFLEKKWSIKGKWCVSFITGASVFIVSLVGDGMITYALAEGVLVFAISVIFTFIPFNISIGPLSVAGVEPYNDPGKARLCESAEVFSKLSQCFSDLPYQKSSFNKSDLERMSNNVYQDFCVKCMKSEECWRKNYLDTAATCSTLFNYMQQGSALSASMVKGRLRSQCIKLHGFLNALTEVYDQARIHLFWYNRLIEHREAVADQLDEMANMIAVVAEEVYENDNVDNETEESIKYAFKDIHLKLDKLTVTYRKDGRQEFFITSHANNVRFVNTKEMASVLSRIVNKRMMPAKDGKMFVTDVPATVLFVEKPKFSVICKAARVIKPGQSVSGDNYMFMETEDGQAIACISDGMGSGLTANKESETVVELMERFIEAGFSKETAVKMINSTMVLTDGEPSCSTVDICSIDLYEGTCDFIKLGAVSSFLKREHFVECISSSTIPVGVLKDPEYENNKRELYDGDFIIMVSDGIIEALGEQEKLVYLIRKQESVNPMEIANNILAGCLNSCSYNPSDDMTVLVVGVWKK